MDPNELVTRKDLEALKKDLFAFIVERLSQNENLETKWLKSKDVRRSLQVSPGTLQSLRVSGGIKYTKIGGSLYYEYKEIIKMLSGRSYD